MNFLEDYESWMVWALAICLGFPLVAIILGELGDALEDRNSIIARPIRELRNRVTPGISLLLFLHHVVGWPWDNTVVRIVATLSFVLGLSTVLAIFNGAIFKEATEASWRARVPSLFLDLARFIIVLVGLSIVMSEVWGADLAGLLTALGVGSIVIGLALQDTLSNIFAGIAILFERPYAEGDWIHFEGHFGQVESINWRSTRMTAHLGDTVVIPNAKIASAILINENNIVSPRYETIEIGFSYDDPPNFVKKVLIETVRTTEMVLNDPPPQVYTKGYGDSAIDYQIRFAVRDIADLFWVKDEIITRIWYAANRNNLNIPFPIRTVYNHDGPTEKKQAAEGLQKESAETLSNLLSLGDTKELPEQLSIERYGEGEIVLRPGDTERVLRVIVSGAISIKERMNGENTELLRLGGGEIFGAASVLRNEPITFMAVAASDLVLVSLKRSLVMELVSNRPSFARQLEEILELRKSALQLARMKKQDEFSDQEGTGIDPAELFGEGGQNL